MRVADFVVRFLADFGVRTAYMVSGTGSIYLDDALAGSSEITTVCARHEAAAALMATGGAKLTGRLGLAVVTSGPGAVNALPGIVDAWGDGVAVLVISGQVETRHIDPLARTFGVQGINVVDCVRSATKYAALVTDPGRIRLELERAVHAATTGRPGPVWLDIPVDVQAAEIDPDALPGLPPPAPDTGGDGARSAALHVLDLLRTAARPLIVVGQGVHTAGAVEPFRELVSRLRVPVVASRLGQDILGYDCPFYLGQAGIRGRPGTAQVTRAADLVISLGSGLATGLVGEDFDAFSFDATVVAVDIDPVQLKKRGVRIDLPICADVGPVVAELVAEAEQAAPGDRAEWLAWCADVKARHATVTPELSGDPINSYWLVSRLERHTGPGDVFVVDTGSAYYVTGQTLEFARGQRELTSSALVNMGAAVPMAVGAAFAAPTARVVTLVGDGALEVNIQELGTVGQYGLNVKVVVVNNGGYSSIRESGDALLDGMRLGEPVSPDFRSIAAGFGLPYRRVDAVAELDGTLAEVLDTPGPTLLEVVCDPKQQLLRPERPDGSKAHDGARRLVLTREERR